MIIGNPSGTVFAGENRPRWISFEVNKRRQVPPTLTYFILVINST